jgi:hypothetical protein
MELFTTEVTRPLIGELSPLDHTWIMESAESLSRVMQRNLHRTSNPRRRSGGLRSIIRLSIEKELTYARALELTQRSDHAVTEMLCAMGSWTPGDKVADESPQRLALILIHHGGDVTIDPRLVTVMISPSTERTPLITTLLTASAQVAFATPLE